MTLRAFVRAHRANIDATINGVTYRHDGNGGRGTIPDPPPRYDDAERALWVANDEALYLWAKAAGVNV